MQPGTQKCSNCDEIYSSTASVWTGLHSPHNVVHHDALKVPEQDLITYFYNVISTCGVSQRNVKYGMIYHRTSYLLPTYSYVNYSVHITPRSLRYVWLFSRISVMNIRYRKTQIVDKYHPVLVILRSDSYISSWKCNFQVKPVIDRSMDLLKLLSNTLCILIHATHIIWYTLIDPIRVFMINALIENLQVKH